MEKVPKKTLRETIVLTIIQTLICLRLYNLFLDLIDFSNARIFHKYSCFVRVSPPTGLECRDEGDEKDDRFVRDHVKPIDNTSPQHFSDY